MYLDPSGNKAGASLDTIYGAATSGALRVDPQTGDATLKFLSEVQELADKMGRQINQVAVRTPLGGGFGEEVGAFNQQLASSGPNSAQDVLAKFSDELKSLSEAVAMSIKSYQAMDGANAHNLTGAAGSGR
jgi:hypothetical protein